ncbi:uncharacterized protein METZ01_LOCUS152042, partial [marine metagenome]
VYTPLVSPDIKEIQDFLYNQVRGDTELLASLGMGLGFWVAQDSKSLGWQSNQREFGWGGVANTVFWIDPVSDSTTMFFTQVMPSSKLGLRVELHRLAASILN